MRRQRLRNRGCVIKRAHRRAARQIEHRQRPRRDQPQRQRRGADRPDRKDHPRAHREGQQRRRDGDEKPAQRRLGDQPARRRQRRQRHERHGDQRDGAPRLRHRAADLPRDQRRDNRDLRQQVMRLFAADRRKDRQRGDKLDGAEPRALVGPQRPRRERAQQRRPAPGPDKQRDQREKEPEWLTMGEGIHHPPRALPPQHLIAILRPAIQDRRDQPQRGQRQPGQHANADAAIPAPRRGPRRALGP